MHSRGPGKIRKKSRSKIAVKILEICLSKTIKWETTNFEIISEWVFRENMNSKVLPRKCPAEQARKQFLPRRFLQVKQNNILVLYKILVQMMPVEKRLPEKIQHLENQVVESNQEWEFKNFDYLKMSFPASTSKQASKLSHEFN